MGGDKSKNYAKNSGYVPDKSKNQAKQKSRKMGDDKRKHIQRCEIAMG